MEAHKNNQETHKNNHSSIYEDTRTIISLHMETHKNNHNFKNEDTRTTISLHMETQKNNHNLIPITETKIHTKQSYFYMPGYARTYIFKITSICNKYHKKLIQYGVITHSSSNY